MGRAFLCAVILCLAAATASAQDRALLRVADIRVELAQDRHNLRLKKLTSEEQARRSETLNNEARTLLAPYRQKSREDYEKAQSTVNGLVNAKLALLRPQWDRELQDFRVVTADKKKQTDFEMETDVRRAVEHQRMRLAFQQQLDRGLIDRDGFAQKDRAAVTAIAALRRKYEAAGGDWPARFDERLTRLTAPLTARPATGTAPQGAGESRPPARVVTPQKPPPAFEFWAKSSFPWGWTIAIIFGGFVLWLIFWGRRQQTDPGPPLTDVHGSANWAPRREKPAADIGSGVMFGKSSHPRAPPDAPGAPVTSAPEAHTLIVAKTGAGKGARVIVPTLLRYEGSMVVIDPKGENAAVTARARRDQLGHKVHILNPWGEFEALYGQFGFAPATFNPLDVLERGDPNAVSIAQSLAATICPAVKDATPFWRNSAAAVLTGILLWLTDRADEQKTLARARDIATMTTHDFSEILVSMAASEAFGGAIGEMVRPMIGMAENTYSGIMSTLAECTMFLSDQRMKVSTDSSSFSMRRLHDEPTTVYVVFSHDAMKTHPTWLTLIIAAAMQGLKRRDKTIPARHRCMFLIDEFGSIGHIADIPRDIALMRGYGLDYTLIVQDFNQLKTHYGDARGTIIGNCAYKWFCNLEDLDTAKYLSETLGKQTVRTISKSLSSGQTQKGASEGESMTYSETGRLLLTPDEILNLGRDAAVLLSPGSPPQYLRPVDYWKLPETFAHLKDQYPAFYWDPPLQYDKNPTVTSSDARGGRSSQASSKMTETQAREILEVAASATREEILAAYRRLMAKVHPDKGGSNFFAQQLNAAKAVLLGE